MKDTNDSFVYCFEITLTNGTLLRLSSSNKAIHKDNIIFSPASGLNIIEGEFNDSAHDYIILSGIFEDSGINNVMNLTDAQVRILIYYPNNDTLKHFVTYYVSIYTKYDLDFQMSLEPETKKYAQNVVKLFSKTCRANFGDSKCKMNKGFYKSRHDILKIDNNIITVAALYQENNYFDYGSAILISEHQEDCAKILKHHGSMIELDINLNNNQGHYQAVILIAGCDKNFVTCCNKFNNAINFRGEPFIPDKDFLQGFLNE